MQCPACNATMPNDSAFCPECGATVDAGDGQAGQTAGGQHGSGQPTGGQGGQPTGGQATGGQGGQPSGGQATGGQGGQPTGGQGGQPGAGGPAGGQAAGGQPARTQQGQPGQPGSGQPRAAGGGQPPYQQGPSIGDYLRLAMDRLPWKSGIIGGLLIYGLLFGLVAIVVSTLGTSNQFGPSPLDIGAAFFIGLITFLSASDLVFLLANAIQDVPGELATGAYDALLTPLLLFVPWLLYATGRQFAKWRDLEDDDILGHVGSGATVVLGALPVALLVGIAFELDLFRAVLIGGIVVPAGAGALGGLMVWAFADQSRAASWGIGFLVGLAAVAILFALTFVWSAPGAGNAVQNAMLGRLIAAIATFVSVSTFGLATGGLGFLAYLVVIGLVVLVGYQRASPDADDAPLVSGIRGGASVVAGYSTFLFFTMILYAGVLTPEGREVMATSDWLAFLPQSTVTQFAQLGGMIQFGGQQALQALPLTTLVSQGDFLNAFAIGAVLFPLIVGGIGGAIAGYRVMDRSPTGAPAGRGPHQPAQPQTAGQAQGGQPQAASQAQGGQPQAAGQGQGGQPQAAGQAQGGQPQAAGQAQGGQPEAAGQGQQPSDDAAPDDAAGDADEPESGDVDGDADESASGGADGDDDRRDGSSD